jgi:LamB/YcsF family
MSQMRRIDLNSDLGEGFGPWSMGDDAAMMDLATSANVACGGHAGDPETMFVTLSFAAQRGVVVGAHPGYADREGFGRRVIPMSEGEIEHMVAAQVGALMGIGAVAGVPVRYVSRTGLSATSRRITAQSRMQSRGRFARFLPTSRCSRSRARSLNPRARPPGFRSIARFSRTAPISTRAVSYPAPGQAP